MTEFSESYIDLIREKYLEGRILRREFVTGDWMIELESIYKTSPYLVTSDLPGVSSVLWDVPFVWLPREGDWLEMLRADEPGIIQVELIMSGNPSGDQRRVFAVASGFSTATASTNVEALALLYFAVKPVRDYDGELTHYKPMPI